MKIDLSTQRTRADVALVAFGFAATAWNLWTLGFLGALLFLGLMVAFTLVWGWVNAGTPNPRSPQFSSNRPLAHGDLVVINGERYRLSDPDVAA